MLVVPICAVLVLAGCSLKGGLATPQETATTSATVLSDEDPLETTTTSAAVDGSEVPLATSDAAVTISTEVASGEVGDKLDVCPFDPTGELLVEAVVDIDSPDVGAALEEQRSAKIAEFSDQDSDFLFISCDRLDPEGERSAFIGISISEPIAFEDYLKLVSEVEIDTSSLERFGSSTHRGGRFEQLCLRNLEEPSFSWCEVNWFDDDLHIVLYVSGSDIGEDDFEAMESGLANVLDRLVTQLADRAE